MIIVDNSAWNVVDYNKYSSEYNGHTVTGETYPIVSSIDYLLVVGTIHITRKKTNKK